MIKMRKYYFYLLITTALVVSCHRDRPVEIPVEPTAEDTFPHPDDLPPTDESFPDVTITWNMEAKKISGDVPNAGYPRIHHIGGDTLFMTYRVGPKTAYGSGLQGIMLTKSFDRGETWSGPELIADRDKAGEYHPGQRYFQFANADFMVLKNGWIMLAFVGTGRPSTINDSSDVEIIISKDRGQNWSPPAIVVTGRSWEPALIQLPDGTIDIFYSSEARWVPGPDFQQEILMISSKDNGQTWTQPITASYSPGNRDGMAVPVVLQGGKGIVFPVESPGQVFPWIIWSSVKANFNYAGYGTVENGRRWYVDPPPVAYLGGAPYLIQLPGGATVLAVQAAAGRPVTNNFKHSTYVTLTGNSVAKNFGNPEIAWQNLSDDEGVYFGSICISDDTTIFSAVAHNFPDNHDEVWIKKGKISYH